MEEFRELREGKIVEIFAKPITEENSQGMAEIIKIEAVIRNVKNIYVRLIVCFGGRGQWVYRTKYYKK